MLSDEDILRYYKDETFPGSFASGKVLQLFLKTELNEDVSLPRIYKVLQTQPFYVYQLRQRKRFPRRKYDVKRYLELLQADLVKFHS